MHVNHYLTDGLVDKDDLAKVEHHIEHLQQEIRDLKDIVERLEAELKSLRWQMHESSEGNE